jgi:glycosyltransferase involved in cell wall biosynthesis
MRTTETLKIAIDIDVTPGVSGGIAQSTQGLVASLGALEGPEEFLLVTDRSEQADWIQESCGANSRVMMMPYRRGRKPAGPPLGSGVVKRVLWPAVNMIRHAHGRLFPQIESPRIPVSDGYYESLGCDVLHFPTQSYTLCALPTIYNPHDLQHLHYPQFFTARELAYREAIYRSACQISTTVVVGSEWIKQDVVRQYAVSPAKVQIIPWAPPTAYFPEISPTDLEDARRRLALPQHFMFYPAVTWPHKNHLRLLDALAYLRDRRGVSVNLVCTGARYESHWPKVEQRVNELGLGNQVTFLGFLSEADLRSVYRLAQFLVLPTLFEADSCPIHEAWSEGLPVASSSHTALPEQVGDAGLLFDAADVIAIADAVQRMSQDGAFRRQLVERGRRRVKDFDWNRTAMAYRAVYRRAGGQTLSEEDRWLLQWDWMKEPAGTAAHGMRR